MAFNLPTFFKQRKQDIDNVDRNGRNADFDCLASPTGGGGGANVKHQLNWVQPNNSPAPPRQFAVRSPSPSFLSTIQRQNSRAPSPQASALEAEDLDENKFYVEVDQRFSYIFARVSVLCVPHTWSIGGLEIDKDFVETHALVPSPYYQGQFQSLNGKVVSIENDVICEMTGFRNPRNVQIISEELMYNDTYGYRKIRMLLIDRPLEGEGTRTPEQYIPFVPQVREFNSDLEFLKSFPENAAALQDLDAMLHAFVETYIYLRGWTSSTVEKIQNIYHKATQNILKSNEKLRNACRVQSESDHFLELVENVVMGHLHEKIYIQSLCPPFSSRDRDIESLLRAYCRDTISLRNYDVGDNLRDMPRQYFDQAIRCLRRMDTDNGLPDPYPRCDGDEPVDPTEPTFLATTPLEKLYCVKRTLELISSAGEIFVQENGTAQFGSNERAMITTDDLIPLLAYVVVRSLKHVDSLVFYMKHFRLSQVERSELSHALVSLQASIEFLRSDPLGIHDASSTLSTNSNSSNVSVLSHKTYPGRSSSRSSSISIPTSPPLLSPPIGPYIFNTQQKGSNLGLAGTGTSPTSASSGYVSAASYHRKGVKIDFHNADAKLNAFDPNQLLSPDRSESQQRSRRSSLTPNLIVKPPIVLPAISESRRSLDIHSDWLVHERSERSERTAALADNAHYPSRPIIPPVPLDPVSRPRLSAKMSSPLLIFPPVSAEPPPIPVKSKSSTTMTTTEERTVSRNKSPVRTPPDVIDLRLPRGSFEGAMRPTSALSRRPVFESDLDNDDMGDFLTALSSTPEDIVGERGGRVTYRTSPRWHSHALTGK